MKLTAYVLLFGFLFQPLLVYWSSPWLHVNTSNGLIEITCALKAKVTHDIDTSSNPAEKLAKEKYCPALKLVDMANSTLRFAIPVYQSRTLYLIALLRQSTEHQHFTFHYDTNSTRAPPQLS